MIVLESSIMTCKPNFASNIDVLYALMLIGLMI